MDGSNERIWRVSVQPTSTNLPIPGSSDAARLEQRGENLYTKTSLVADSDIRNLNREILSASQAYNNTPKPFRKQFDETITTPNVIYTTGLPAVVKNGLQQVKFINQQQNTTTESIQAESSIKEMQAERIVGQEENMAPKLVHKQYNSPIDLYSMNNIRKTIEAHTELIAPGIKGINFMKPEAPVNKQSEVYKLVKEEEELRNRQRVSPISGQPVVNNRTPIVQNVALPSTCVGQCNNQQHQQQQYLQQQQHQEANFNNERLQSSQITNQAHGSSSSLGEMSQHGNIKRQTDVQVRPACCECGQFIVGPFAKIQNRFVHPSCFNCTTCGTSLKNTGYFTINEKLYCEIHAKQVAKVMRIRFDFDDKNQNQSAISSMTTGRTEQSQQSEPRVSCAPSQQLAGSNNANNSTVTISTMFANRANSEIRHDNQQQQQRATHWSWQPSDNKVTVGGTFESCSSNRMQAVPSSSLQAGPSSSHSSTIPMGQQQSLLSSERRECGQLREESSLLGARTPICVHCHARIQGPYVLAGKTTWCKLCSQSNFQCSSCHRSLLNTGFIEDSSHKYYCEQCFEVYYAPICSKCNLKIKGDCLNALNKQWHPSCFVCGHCHRPFGNSSFYLEDNMPYCERDWNALFTTKCFACSNPIEAGDKWIEALNRNYHSNCFRCTSCHANLEGSTFYCKGGKPYCRLHAR